MHPWTSFRSRLLKHKSLLLKSPTYLSIQKKKKKKQTKKKKFGPKNPNIDTQGSNIAEMFGIEGLDISVISDLREPDISIMFDFQGLSMSLMSNLFGLNILVIFYVWRLNILIMFGLWESNISFYVQTFKTRYLSYVQSSRIWHHGFEFFIFLLHLHWRFSWILTYKLHLIFFNCFFNNFYKIQN